MRTKARYVFVVVLALTLIASVLQIAAGQDTGPTNKILKRALDIDMGRAQQNPNQPAISSGVVYTLLQASGEISKRVENAGKAKGQGPGITPASGTGGCPNTFTGGGTKGGPNTRVNQDCSLRRQAEETIAINPTNEDNLIAGQNDSRIGYNHCGYDWSFDGGKTWGDMIPPFWQFVLLDGHTSDACSDPTATFDSQGNAYVGGIIFDVASNANAIVVAKSNAGIGGAYYHTPADIPFQEYQDTPLGVVANDNDPRIFNDKEFIVADSSSSSPKADNVYATWTRFAFTGEGVGSDSPIYFSQSTDGGATWSPGVMISGSNPEICTVASGLNDPNACDQDQGSHPIVGKDGTVYVAFGNGNTPLPGINQVLMVSCPPTADCSDPASWTTPSKVGDLIGNYSRGPSSAGCPGGRACLPPNGYRVSEFTSITISADDNNNLYVSWADFRNGADNCKGSASTATPPCDNDVFYSYSTDGGTTWSPTFNITPASQFGESAQWQPWSGVVADGSKLWVGYYDRSYGNCEFDGCNDITLAGISNPASASPKIDYTRLTTDSMPNLTPENNPAQAGFLGDYMWVAVDSKGNAHVVWADTRGLNGTVEEDIYYSKVR